MCPIAQVEKFREEHRSTLEWLNGRTDSNTQFFGVTVEIFRIDDSKPAYRFRTVISPNDWEKAKRPSSSSSVSPRAEAYREYFQDLIDELREKHHFTGARLGQPQSWYSFGSGISGITYGACFAQGEKARVEVYIDQGNAEANKRLFDFLAASSQEIEKTLGKSLEWERLDDRRASRIALYRAGSIENDEDTLNELRAWMIEWLLKLKKVFSPKLRLYKKNMS